MITQFIDLQINWNPLKNLKFADLLSKNVSLEDPHGHRLTHKEIPKDIRFFKQSGHEFQYLFDHNHNSFDDTNDDFSPIVCTHMGETKTFQLKNEGTEMICTIFDSESPKALCNVSDSFRAGKNNNTGRKWQASTMVAEAEVHENYSSEIESDRESSDNKASNEDLALNQEVDDSPNTNLY